MKKIVTLPVILFNCFCIFICSKAATQETIASSLSTTSANDKITNSGLSHIRGEVAFPTAITGDKKENLFIVVRDKDDKTPLFYTVISLSNNNIMKASNCNSVKYELDVPFGSYKLIAIVDIAEPYINLEEIAKETGDNVANMPNIASYIIPSTGDYYTGEYGDEVEVKEGEITAKLYFGCFAKKLKEEILDKGKLIEGITIPEGSKAVFYSPGKPQSIDLTSEAKIQGIYVKGLVQFYESGKVKLAILSREQEIDGYLCSADTQIMLYESGKLQTAGLVKDYEIQGIKFVKGDGVSFYESGKLEASMKYVDIDFQGIPCKQGWIRLYETGELLDATLSQDKVINGISFLKGTAIEFYKSGLPMSVRLHQAQTIRGITFLKDTSVRFTESGGFAWASLNEDQQIQQIFCSHGSVDFYESGVVKKAKLAKDQEIQGVKFIKGTSIMFREDAKLKSAWLIKEQEIQDIPCALNYVGFSTQGKVEVATLSQNKDVQGVICAKGSVVHFYESGKLKKAKLAQSQHIQGILCSQDDVEFYESGKLKRGTLDKEQKIQNILCSKGSIDLYESGKVEKATLAKDQKIGGIWCLYGPIELYESGKPKYIRLANDQQIRFKKYAAGEELEFLENGEVISHGF